MKVQDLRLLVMHVSARCDQACAHCSIWKHNGRTMGELGVDERLAIIREARTLGARAVLFTGGEPLLCDHIEILARSARAASLSVQIATNGLGLSQASGWLGDAVQEIYVSIEGPEEVHDGVRGARMFARLRASLGVLLALPRRPRLIGRSTLTARNAGALEATVRTAKSLGLDGLSFLSVDVTSAAFGGEPAGRTVLRPGAEGVMALRAAISRLDAAGELGAFVLEDARKLQALADFASDDPSARRAPACDAPEWSSVVEANGAIRPCFFQPPITMGYAATLGETRRSEEYAAALRGLGQGNSTCASCVCPKQLASPSLRHHVKHTLGRAFPQLFPQQFQRRGSAA